MAQIYYNTIDKLKEELLKDVNVNAAENGPLDSIAIAKQTIFPLSHFNILGGAYLNGIWSLNITLYCLDIVDQSKTNIDNEEDILNTQMAVITKLIETFTRGEAARDLYLITSASNAIPLRKSQEDDLAGWSIDFVMEVPNTDIGICDDSVYDIVNNTGNIINNGEQIINTL